MAVGLVTLGGLSGCTQIAQRSGSPVLLASAGTSNARKRLARLAHEAKEVWKEVLRDFNRWKATGDEKIKLALPEKIRRAKASVLAVADSLDTEGLTPELNEKLAKADFDSVSEAEIAKVVSKIVKDLSDTGLSKDEVWNQLLRGNPSLGREKILKLGGISSYLRYLLVNNLEELMRSSSSYAELTFYKFYKQAVSDPCLGLKLICILLALGHLIFFLSADDQADILGAAIWVSFSLGAFSPFCSLPESCPEEGEPGGGEKPGEDEELTP